MARRKAPEDLSVEELRRLLVEKRRGARKERLEHFRQTGRVVDLAPETPQELPEPSLTVDTMPEGEGALPQGPRRRVMDGVLLGIEVVAVLGLVGVLMSGLGLLRDLNREVAAALN